MTNLPKLDFKALAANGENYLSWQSDAKIHLQSKKLDDAIKEGKKVSSKNKASALIFLRQHIHEDLKNEYLTEEDPLSLWISLKDRYEHQKFIILQNAQREWSNLRFQDYKTISDYNSVLFNIVSRLKLCGEKVTDAQMLEKTLSTFHASNVLLQQQYREKGFSKYSELTTCLIVAEQNSKVLIENHNSRPSGSMTIPEANANFGRNEGSNGYRGGGSHNSGRNNITKRGGYNNSSNRGGYKGSHNNKFKYHQKRSNPHFKQNQNLSNNFSQHSNNVCIKCGEKGHWSRVCRARLEENYQTRIKAIETDVWDASTSMESPINITGIEFQDFFEDTDGMPLSNEAFDAKLGAPPS